MEEVSYRKIIIPSRSDEENDNKSKNPKEESASKASKSDTVAKGTK